MELPQVFIENELNLTRLEEMLLYIINRATVGPEAHLFDSTPDPSESGADKSRLVILSLLAAILINLHNYQIQQNTRSFSLTLIAQSSFQMKSFEYFVSYNWTPDVSELISEKIIKFVQDLKQQEEIYQQHNNNEENTEPCSICYSAPIDATFSPCGHSSCHRCIERHLLNSKNCFFCNTKVEEVVREKEKNGNC